MNHTRSILSVSMAIIMLLTLSAVCTTTSVSAVPVAKTIGPAVAGLPINDGSSGFHMFHVGASDGRMYWTYYNYATPYARAGWDSTYALNGWTKATPAALIRNPNLVELFHTGMDGAVYYKRSTNGGQSLSIGGWTRVVSAGMVDPRIGPAVCPWQTGSGSGFDLFFVRASNHQLYGTRYYDATSTTAAHWGPAYAINGWTFATPAAMSRTTNAVELFHTGTDGHLYYKSGVAGVGQSLATGRWTVVPPT